MCAVMAQKYWQVFGKEEDSFRRTMAEIAVKNRGYARMNPHAQGPLDITVEDDGDGFIYNEDLVKLKSNSYGLFSVQERLSDLGGSFTIDSVIDKGTIARISVPLKNDG